MINDNHWGTIQVRSNVPLYHQIFKSDPLQDIKGRLLLRLSKN